MVALNDTTLNINFSLAVGGKISGKVTMPGAFATSVDVYAQDTISYENYSGSTFILFDSASYEIRRLPTGIYKVNTANSDSFVDKYYNNKSDWASADPISVTQGVTTSGINFTLSLGGKITGTITLPGASSVFASFTAINTATGTSYYGSAFNFSGNTAPYEIYGLPTGTYKVSASDDMRQYLEKYYNNKPDETSADPVSVIQGSTTPNINFTLGLGGVIKGNVSSSTKGVLKDISVVAFSTTYSLFWVAYGVSDASGNYRLSGLPTGYYKLFTYGDTTYAVEFYNGKDSWNSADSFLVTAADSVIGKNFTLDLGGSISGHVYCQGGAPDSGANVSAVRYSGNWYESGEATTGIDGSYRIGGLRTGYYIVSANDGCRLIFYDNKESYLDADSVHVIMPSETNGINFNIPSAVQEGDTKSTSRPNEFSLGQNYPNPFNPTTIIEYTLQKKALVKLEIYNLLGQKVKTLVGDYQSVGAHQILWDGKNEAGKVVSSGIYFYRLEVNGVTQNKKMVLLK